MKERHNLIRPLRNGGLSFEEVRELGFKVSKHLWHKSLENVKRNIGIKPNNYLQLFWIQKLIYFSLKK